MATIANASSAYVAGGNGNAYQIYGSQYLNYSSSNISVFSCKALFVKSTNSTATINVQLNYQGQYVTNYFSLIVPQNISNFQVTNIVDSNGNNVSYQITNGTNMYTVKPTTIDVVVPTTWGNSTNSINFTVSLSNVNYQYN